MNKTIASTTKPNKPYDHKIDGPGGHSIEVLAHATIAGAWLELSGNDHGLHLISSAEGCKLNYVGYRDGTSQADRIAIGVDENGEVGIQIIIPGVGSDAQRFRHLTLKQLDALAAAL